MATAHLKLYLVNVHVTEWSAVFVFVLSDKCRASYPSL